MRFSLLTISTLGVLASPAFAQAPPPMKMVTPEECQMVTRRSPDEFYVTGPLRIGRVILRDEKIRRNEKTADGINAFGVLDQFCSKAQ